MTRIVNAEISVEALNYNYQRVKEISNGRRVLAMVKANGYGHGLIPVSRALTAADALGVARLEEGVLIAEAGVKTPVVLMEGCFSEEELKTAIHHHFQIVVHAPYQVTDLLKCKSIQDAPFNVWLKINTGMNRLGFRRSEFEKAYDLLKNQKHIHIIGFMTHFAQADEVNEQVTARQYSLFEEIVGQRPGLRSSANSAAILAWPQTHVDWVRPGLMLYGASPFPDKTGYDLGLKSVMRLTTGIIAIHDLNPGDQIGYGGIHRCDKPQRVAIAAIGYGDGYPWSAIDAPVYLEGVHAKTLGRVSMDMIAIDISDIPNANLRSEVELWGPHVPVEKVAKICKTLPYELFTRLTRRVKLQMV